MAETYELIAFVVLAAATLGGALGMLTSRNVVHSAFWLLSVSVSTAGIFALLHATYLAIMQLLVYAGAVAILNLFTIMITLRRREDAVRSRDFSALGVVLALAFFGTVAAALSGGVPITVTPPDTFPGVEEFGAMLFSLDGWALPFEIASLILTAALVAAVWWSREGDER